MRLWFAIVVALLCAAEFTSCQQAGLDMECNQHPALARRWPSPDGRLRAVEYRTNCPGWYAAEVQIVAADGTKPTAFTVRPTDQVRPAVWPELKVEWKSDRELWITYPGRQDTTCISSVGGVTVHCLDGSLSGGATEARAQ